MNAHAPCPPPEVAAFFSHGRLVSLPRRAARRALLLRHLAERLFTPDRVYTEREVNEALLTLHEDFSALRRDLVEAGLLVRARDGSHYRRPDPAAGPAGAAP